MSESNKMGRMEQLNCDAVAKEASVEPEVRFGALMLFTGALIESRALVLQHHWSLDTGASRKTDVYSFSLHEFMERTNSAVNYQQFTLLASGEMNGSVLKDYLGSGPRRLSQFPMET